MPLSPPEASASLGRLTSRIATQPCALFTILSIPFAFLVRRSNCFLDYVSSSFLIFTPSFLCSTSPAEKFFSPYRSKTDKGDYLAVLKIYRPRQAINIIYGLITNVFHYLSPFIKMNLCFINNISRSLTNISKKWSSPKNGVRFRVNSCF